MKITGLRQQTAAEHSTGGFKVVIIAEDPLEGEPMKFTALDGDRSVIHTTGDTITANKWVSVTGDDSPTPNTVFCNGIHFFKSHTDAMDCCDARIKLGTKATVIPVWIPAGTPFYFGIDLGVEVYCAKAIFTLPLIHYNDI